MTGGSDVVVAGWSEFDIGIVSATVAQPIAVLNDLVIVSAIDTAGHNIHREDFDRFVEVLRSWSA